MAIVTVDDFTGVNDSPINASIWKVLIATESTSGIFNNQGRINAGEVSFWEDPNNFGQGVFDTADRGAGVPNARAAFLTARPWRSS